MGVLTSQLIRIATLSPLQKFVKTHHIVNCKLPPPERAKGTAYVPTKGGALRALGNKIERLSFNFQL